MGLMLARGGSSLPASVPTWLSGVPLMTWTEISGTRLDTAQSGFTSPGGPKAHVMSYSGATIKESGSEVFVIGGGHADYAGNEVYSLRLSDNAPAWERRNDPTATVGATNIPGPSHYSDGRPAARHTYWDFWHIAARSRVFLIGAGAVWGNGNGNHATVDAFDPTTNDYEAAGTYADGPSGMVGAEYSKVKDNDENIWVFSTGGPISRWNQSDASWTSVRTGTVYDPAPIAFDSSRNRALRIRSSAVTYDLSNDAAETGVTIGGSAAASVAGAGYMQYSADRDSYIYASRELDFYEIDAATFEAESLPVSGTLGATVDGDGTDNLYGRFNCAPELNVFYLIKAVDQNVWFFRTQ